MKLLCSIFLLLPFWATAQQQYDLVSYKPPAGWVKEVSASKIDFKTVATDTAWCAITLYKSINSKGSNRVDFENDWQDLVKKTFAVRGNPQVDSSTKLDGWKVTTGAAPFKYSKNDALVMLVTFTGFNKTISLLAVGGQQKQFEKVFDFIKSMHIAKPVEVASTSTAEPPKSNPPASSFTFNTTNFDDGWTSTIQINWVEVAKGNFKVFIHYPDKQTDAYNSVLKAGNLIAWNTLVAPKYTNIQNFSDLSIQSFESIVFMEADAIERASNKPVHVVLFKKHFYNGNGRYVEFVSPTKGAFETEFGAYHKNEFGWDKLTNMQWKNRFAVSANDIVGKWSANDYASLRYYYAGSGNFAGATATSTADEFTFLPNNKYQSDHAGASGVVGNQQFSRQVYKGNSVVTNWTITLTNRFKGASETYNCYYEAVKNGRILMLTNSRNHALSLVKQ